MNTKAASSPDHHRLYQIAEAQAGYFTAAQAGEAGFSHALLAYHVRAALLDRIVPGVYRLLRFPASPHEDLFVAWLRVSQRAVISHDSALALFDLSDWLPSEIHLTIPRTTSRRHSGLRLHTNRLTPEEIIHYAGLPVTTPVRTIVDVAASGLREELVAQAIHEVLRRGLATAEQILAAGQRRNSTRKVIERMLNTEAVP